MNKNQLRIKYFIRQMNNDHKRRINRKRHKKQHNNQEFKFQAEAFEEIYEYSNLSQPYNNE